MLLHWSRVRNCFLELVEEELPNKHFIISYILIHFYRQLVKKEMVLFGDNIVVALRSAAEHNFPILFRLLLSEKGIFAIIGKKLYFSGV